MRFWLGFEIHVTSIINSETFHKRCRPEEANSPIRCAMLRRFESFSGTAVVGKKNSAAHVDRVTGLPNHFPNIMKGCYKL